MESIEIQLLVIQFIDLVSATIILSITAQSRLLENNDGNKKFLSLEAIMFWSFYLKIYKNRSGRHIWKKVYMSSIVDDVTIIEKTFLLWLHLFFCIYHHCFMLQVNHLLFYGLKKFELFFSFELTYILRKTKIIYL